MRVTTRIVSAVLATMLVVASLVALAELALAVFGRDPWLVDWRAVESFGQEHSWDDAVVRLIATALIAAGVVLLVVALRPRPPVVLDSDASTGPVRLRIRTRSLELLLDRELRRLDDVATVASHWNTRGVTVRVETRRSQPGHVEGAVRTRASEVLDRLGIRPDGLRVLVRSTAGASAPGPSVNRPRGGIQDHPPTADEDGTAVLHSGATR